MVPLEGELALLPPAEDVALRLLPWRNVVSDLDILLYTTRKLRARSLPGGKRTLLAGTIAKLAVWDPAVVDRLAEARPEEVLLPEPLLRELAEERGWTPATSRSWWEGTVQQVDGRDQVHSSLLAFQDPEGVLRYRMWSAQAGVLLPLIEERRQALVRRFRNLLARHDPTQDPWEMEIGSLAFCLRNLPVDPRARSVANQLRRLRNELAHLQPLSPAEALELFEERQVGRT